VDALCATTEAGVEGCVCADGSTARAISEPLRPGGIAVPTVTCQVNDLEFLASEVEAGGVADPCETYSCGDSGACVAVNGFPTCRCDEGFAAVPVGDGTAVCARVRRTFGPDQIGRLAGCSSCDASAGSASLFSLLALLPLIRRRRS
jgi:hypothetical protein